MFSEISRIQAYVNMNLELLERSSRRINNNHYGPLVANEMAEIDMDPRISVSAIEK